MPISQGRIQHCMWSVISGTFSDDEWSEYVEGMRRDLEAVERETRGALGLLTVAVQCDPPTATQRKAIADLRRSELGGLVQAHAFVTESVLLRGGLTAINWLADRSFEEKVFGNVDPAIGWLATKYAGISRSELARCVDGAMVAQGLGLAATGS